MRLNKAQRMMERLDKKVSGKLSDVHRGQVNLSLREQMANTMMQDAAERVKKEGIE